MSLVGAYRRLFPEEEVVQIARGPAAYCSYTATTTMKEAATMKCPPTVVENYTATQILYEGSYEPYSLRGDPDQSVNCKLLDGTEARCCDSSNSKTRSRSA